MTACESSGYTGASFSITTRQEYTVFLGAGGVVINNILFLAEIISSPRPQMLVLCFFSEGLTRPQKKRGPFFVLFLSVTLICISPHIGKQRRLVFGSRMSLNITRYPGDTGGKKPPLFPRLAQVQPAVKSLRFVYSLWIRTADYGYMCMIHEHTAVLSVTVQDVYL